ncbi:MAG: molybdate ABC transporter substrate-binding protein [Clostridium sp.]|nr:molybdate ABC transporter substrate-binding protein [Clostridium sp.]
MHKKNLCLWFVFIVFLLLTLTGCPGRETAPPPSPAPQPAPVSLTVSAAASLTDALNELIAIYQEKNPHVTITTNYAGSGALQRQIEEGAPVDLFISAAPRHMDTLEEGNLLLAGTRVDILGNTMVLIAREGLELAEGFVSLKEDTVRKIALGEPESVPAGRYGKEALTYLGLWDQLEHKFVFGKDVRQVLTWVEGGDADVGLVYLTDAKTAANIAVLATAPEGSHKPILYPAAVIKNSQVPEAAQDFLTFLSGAEADAVFAEYGFTVPAN